MTLSDIINAFHFYVRLNGDHAICILICPPFLFNNRLFVEQPANDAAMYVFIVFSLGFLESLPLPRRNNNLDFD